MNTRTLFMAGVSAMLLAGAVALWWVATSDVSVAGDGAGSPANAAVFAAAEAAAIEADDTATPSPAIVRAPFTDTDTEEESAAAAPAAVDGTSSLRMTLVLPDGKPAASGFVEVEQRGSRICQNRADRDGVAVFSRVPIEGGPLRIVVGHARKRYFATIEASAAPDPSKPRLLDLGTIALKEIATWCSGRVLDAEGRPAPYARLKITAVDAVPVLSKTEFELRSTERIEISGPHVDGSFSIHTERAASTIVVVVRAENLLDAIPAVLARGAMGVDLRTGPATGRISGTVGGARPPPVGLEVSLRSERLAAHSEATALSPSQTRVNSDRTFALVDLRPGVYELTLAVPSADGDQMRVLARIGGVLVPSGGVATDPRLFDIALSGPFALATVALVDEAGRAVEGCRATFENRTYRELGGSFTLVGAVFPLEIDIRHPKRDYRRVHLSINGDRTVVMRPTIEIELQVTGLGAGSLYGPGLVPAGKSGDAESERTFTIVPTGQSFGRWTGGPLPRTSAWRYRIDDAGDFDVRWSYSAVDPDNERRTASFQVLEGVPQSKDRITVRDIPGLQTFVVSRPIAAAPADAERK